MKKADIMMRIEKERTKTERNLIQAIARVNSQEVDGLTAKLDFYNSLIDIVDKYKE